MKNLKIHEPENTTDKVLNVFFFPYGKLLSRRAKVIYLALNLFALAAYWALGKKMERDLEDFDLDEELTKGCYCSELQDRTEDEYCGACLDNARRLMLVDEDGKGVFAS